jgi:hypothetical protein
MVLWEFTHWYDSMAALDLADEKDVIEMTEDASIGMKTRIGPSS